MTPRNVFVGAALIFVIAAGVLWSENSGTTQAQLGSLSKIKDHKNCDLVPHKRQFSHQPYYTGPLIDAHLHMPVSSKIVSAVGKKIGFSQMTAFGGKVTLDYIMCLFQSEGITQTIGFFMTTPFSSSAELGTAKRAEKTYPKRIAVFYMPGPYETLRVAPEKVRSVIEKNKALFRGIGELKSFDGSSLDNPYFSEMFKIANDNNLVIMMHPYHNHKAVVEKIVKEYPKVTFLLHGGHDSEWITDVMRKYNNVYYSIDADIAALYGWERQHKDKEPTKEEFLAYLHDNFDAQLNEQIRYWGPKIASYPDKFMWGTDRWYGWHFDYEVGGLIEEFGRTFIGRLDPSIRERFAYKNAERLLQSR
ncbi:MAG: amidohydrolase family protein [Parcubacteria group bacterium]|nr:amidohydrolase family protein [Parcubacteria group bacterium]